jgi:small subunit ribosomal protein S1
MRFEDVTTTPETPAMRNGQHVHEEVGAMTDMEDAPDISPMSDTSIMSDASESGETNEMQRLLDEEAAQFRTLKRGDVVEGQIVHMDADEILVDIGLKSEGVLSTKELPASGYGAQSELKVGDNVLVYVVQPETPDGHPVVSIKRARQERQWRIAQEQYERGELLEAEVVDHNKGGLIVNLENIRGFVPISQILNLKREDSADNAETQTKLQAMVGRKLQLKIIEINRNRNRLILSERLAVQEWRQRRREELLNELQVGEVRQGVVSNLANFGAFVDLGGADGLVHISQLAWSRVNHPSEVLKVGQEVEVQVLSVDKEKKKIALSIKRAEVDPWTTVQQRYSVGQLVHGTITKIAPFGAFARIEDGVEGLIHLSELPAGTQDPKSVLHEGEEVTVRIVRIEPERRRLGLSLKQVSELAAEAAPAAEGEALAEEAPGAVAAAGEPARARQPREEAQPQTAMAAAFAAAQQANQRSDVPAETPEASQVAEAAASAASATGTPPAEVRESAATVAGVEAPAVTGVPEAELATSETTPTEVPSSQAEEASSAATQSTSHAGKDLRDEGEPESAATADSAPIAAADADSATLETTDETADSAEATSATPEPAAPDAAVEQAEPAEEE